MQKIAFFGKGGIGKSTLAANLSVVYAKQGLRVLLVGCDPKHDTTTALTDGRPIPTIIDQPAFMEDGLCDISRILVRGRLGVDCVEAGGPEPGIGCAGRGISRMVEVLEESGVLREDRYDVALFDVLGDVVCGGFAAPLRQGIANKVCILASEELMALYAANNIARAIKNYSCNGASLLGLVTNLRDVDADRKAIERFAGFIGTRVLSFLSRDPVVREAEYRRVTVLEHAPDSKIAGKIRELAAELMRIEPQSHAAPTPLSDERFNELARNAFNVAVGDASSGTGTAGAPGLAVHAGRKVPAPEAKAEWKAAPADRDENIEHVLAGLKAPATRRTTPSDGDRSARGVGGGPNSEQWGAADQWRQFFCDREARRNATTGLERASKVLRITHQDLECQFATPNFNDGNVSYFNFPWAGPAGERLSSGSQPMGGTSPQGPAMSTNLREQDVIRGGGGKLEGALQAAMGETDGLDAIVVKSTCVPTVIGDDTEAVIGKYRKRSKIPVLYTNPAANRAVATAKTLFERVRQDHAFLNIRRRKCCINLVGFPDGTGLQEVIGLLRQTGIVVNTCVMPGLDSDQARHYLAASLQVFYPNAAYEDTYREVFESLPIKSLTLDAPCGMEGTRRWLCAVASRFGLGRKARSVFDKTFARRAREWEAGRREAGGCRVAFVVDYERMKRLTDPKLMWGVPAVRMLREMGFGIDILFYGQKDQGPLFGFRTPEELQERLQKGGFQAVYSEYFFDRRLTQAGKAQFSLAFFEMGLTGAVRSLRRLNGVCHWPFYRRYAKYL